MPSFIPEFDVPGFGEYGRWDWYKLYLFSMKNPWERMTYESGFSHYMLKTLHCLTLIIDHCECVNLMHAKNDISITKVTHGGRGYTVKTVHENDSSADSAKALGGWSESGLFQPCYGHAHPVDAMLGAATFNGNKPESYFLPRGVLGRSIFSLMSINMC